MMNNVRSITTVNTTNGWAVCQTNSDGTALFIMHEVYETPYTEEHARVEAEALKEHLESGGKSYAKPLPPGVSVLH